ncbi:MAG TPA: hypothetical protein VGM80_01325 [Gaiellaceae bacterium]|jgi:hypothetical protein
MRKREQQGFSRVTGTATLTAAAVVSSTAMVVGALGRWDGAGQMGIEAPTGPPRLVGLTIPNGWGVVAAAVAGGACALVIRRSRAGGIPLLVAGLAGAAVAIHFPDETVGIFPACRAGISYGCSGPVHAGWGLTVATLGSVCLAGIGIVWLAAIPAVSSRSLAGVLAIGIGIAILFAFTPVGIAGQLTAVLAGIVLVRRRLARIRRRAGG